MSVLHIWLLFQVCSTLSFLIFKIKKCHNVFHSNMYRKLSPDIIKWLVNDAYVHEFEDGRKSNWQWTPLVYACGGSYGEIVGLLLECKAGILFELCKSNIGHNYMNTMMICLYLSI